MKNNLFEKNINSKLGNMEIAPSDGLFDKTMQKRTLAQKKSLTPFLYKTFAVLLVSASVIGAIWYLKQDNPQIKTSTIVSQDVPEVKLESLQDDFEIKPDNKVEISNVDKLKANNETKVGVKSKTLSKINNNGSKLTSRDNLNKNKSIELSHNTGNNKSIFEDNGENIYERYFDANSKYKPSLSKEFHQGNSHLYVFNSIDESLVDAVFVNHLKIAKYNKFTNHFPKNEFYQVTNQTEFSRSSKSRKPIFFDVFGLLGFAKAMPFNGEMSNLMKTGSEVVQNSAYGFRVITPLKDRWSVFSGLNVHIQNAKYQFDYVTISNEKEVKLVTRYLNDPILGVVPFSVLDTVDVTKSITNTFQLKNNYKLIQIPFGFSYHIAYKKFDVGVNLSSMLNVNVQSQIMNIDDLKVQTIESSKHTFSMSHALGLQVAYGLSPKWKVFAEPSLQFLTIQSKKVGNSIDERFLNRQLALGLKYSLF
jgi:hypothetical protein